MSFLNELECAAIVRLRTTELIEQRVLNYSFNVEEHGGDRSRLLHCHHRPERLQHLGGTDEK